MQFVLKPEHKQHILEHEQDIREGNWEEFFKPDMYTLGIGEPLYLANIPFMEYLKRVPEYAFYDSEKLTSVVIPAGVTSIGRLAFCSCTGITSITIPDSVTSISFGAFSYCTKLTSIELPASVTEIGENAFYQCEGLTSVVFPNSVITIGDDAFSNCSGLTRITIPASVTSIGTDAFWKCRSLTNITYEGTKEQWEQIYNKEAFANVYFTVNCTDGQIIKKKKK